MRFVTNTFAYAARQVSTTLATLLSGRRTLAFCAAALFLGWQSVNAAPGDLDPFFGTAGKVVTNILDGQDGASAVAIQPDGKIVVAGVAGEGSGIGSYFAVVRYNSDGTLDNTFGIGGMVATDFDSDSATVDVAIQADGKIVVVGKVGPADAVDFGIIRFLADGTLDPDFGSGGKLLTDFSGAYDGAEAIAIQSDGKLVVAGISQETLGVPTDFAVARFLDNGDLDLTFGTDGKVTLDFSGTSDRANDVAIQPDGKIVLVGTAGNGFGIARLNTNGQVDAGFGLMGKATAQFLGNGDEAHAVAVQADAKIVVAGRANSIGILSDFGLMRFEPNGELDAGFGIGGKVTTDFLGFGDRIFDIVIQPNGHIVAAGQVSPNLAELSFGIARYLTNGDLDSSFGTAGKLTTEFESSDSALGVALQEDCKIVAVGFSNPDNTSDSVFAVARYDAGPCGSAPPCPLGHGFWKNDPTAWAVDTLLLGGKSYSKAELQKLLGDATKTDASIILARQLIAAKLNLLNGSDPAPIQSTIDAADGIFAAYPGKLAFKVKPATPAGKQMEALGTSLDNYNNGLMTPTCSP